MRSKSSVRATTCITRFGRSDGCRTTEATFAAPGLRPGPMPKVRYPPRVCISRCASRFRAATGISGWRLVMPSRSSAPRSARIDQTVAISRVRSPGVAPSRSGRRRSRPPCAYRHSNHKPSAVSRLRSQSAQNGSVVDAMIPNSCRQAAGNVRPGRSLVRALAAMGPYRSSSLREDLARA